MPPAVAVFATPPEDVAISAALSYNPLQSRPARHAVAVLMLLKNKRKPQKASLRRTGRVATVESAGAVRRLHFGPQGPWAQPRPAPRRDPAEGKDAKRVSASIRCGPRAKKDEQNA